MKKHKLLSLSSSLHLCILCLSLINTCRAADYQYEACLPTTNCGSGPNISFPFFVPEIQESYCGFPNFVVVCRNGVPYLQMSENDKNGYIIEDIFYGNRTLRVFNSAALSSANCPPRITNTTLPPGRFDYVRVTGLHLFSGCRNVPEELGRYEVVGCEGSRSNNGSTIAMYESDGNLGTAIERCGENVVAPVEKLGDERESGGVAEVLRRGFLMNWTASDCNDCEESGGRCGFNETSFHFKCFCPDRPHSRSCKPGNIFVLPFFFQH